MFKEVFKNKKIVITGHTGFKGSWLTAWLNQLGAEITGISLDIPTNPSLFQDINLASTIKDIRIDIRDQVEIANKIKDIRPDFIFHLAAQPIVSKSYENPLETLQTNIIGTANILDTIKDFNHQCVAVMITSDKCYENVEWEWGYKETDHLGGKDIYSGSKAGAEIVFHSYFHSFIKKNPNLRVATARAGNVIGGGDWAENRIIPDCVKAWNNKEKVIIRNPNATRPWQHVLEPLSGYLALAMNLYLDEKLNGESFNFGPIFNSNISVIDILCDLSLKWGFGEGNPGWESAGTSKFHEAGLLKLNCDKASFHLKWSPVLNYDELIEFTGEWYYLYNENKSLIKEFTQNQIKEYCRLSKNKDLAWTH